MAKKIKEEPVHHDMFGRQITLGSFVVSPTYAGDLSVMVVEKLNPKMVKIRRINGSAGSGSNSYPGTMVVWPVEEEVTMWVLQNAK